MRLLIVQPTADKRGHYGLYTAKLCQALGRLGHDVTLCTNRIAISRYLAEPPSFRVVEVGNGTLAFEPFDRESGQQRGAYYLAYFRNCRAVTSAAVRLCRRGATFDGVVIMDTEFLTASVVLNWSLGRLPPFVMLLWAANFSFASYAGSLPKRAYKVLQREIFRATLGRRIRALGVLSEWHREVLRKQLRLPKEFPVGIVPDGADIVEPALTQEAARSSLGLRDARTVFLFFGVLRRDKGIEFLLQAMKQIESSDVLLVVAGWPMEYRSEDVQHVVETLGLSGRVILNLRYVPDEDVTMYFAACDAVIFPYTRQYTGGSGPLLKQACTYARPVIASDVSDLGRLVREHRFGLLAEPENPRALARRMLEFDALDEDARRVLAERARGLAGLHTWDAVAQRLGELLSRVVGQPV